MQPAWAAQDAQTLLEQGRTALWEGRETDSHDTLLAALDLFKKAGDKSGAGMTYLELGQHRMHWGTTDEAKKFISLALLAFQQGKDFCGEALAIGYLGALARAKGDNKQAGNMLFLAEKNGREGDCPATLAYALKEQGHLYRKDEPQKAEAKYGEAEVAYQEAGDTIGEAHAIKGRARLYMARDPHHAWLLASEAQMHYANSGYARGIAQCLLIKSAMAMKLDQWDEAALDCRRFLELSEQINQDDGVLPATVMLGVSELFNGNIIESCKHFYAALGLWWNA